MAEAALVSEGHRTLDDLRHLRRTWIVGTGRLLDLAPGTTEPELGALLQTARAHTDYPFGRVAYQPEQPRFELPERCRGAVVRSAPDAEPDSLGLIGGCKGGIVATAESHGSYAGPDGTATVLLSDVETALFDLAALLQVMAHLTEYTGRFELTLTLDDHSAEGARLWRLSEDTGEPVATGCDAGQLAPVRVEGTLGDDPEQFVRTLREVAARIARQFEADRAQLFAPPGAPLRPEELGVVVDPA